MVNDRASPPTRAFSLAKPLYQSGGLVQRFGAGLVRRAGGDELRSEGWLVGDWEVWRSVAEIARFSTRLFALVETRNQVKTRCLNSSSKRKAGVNFISARHRRGTLDSNFAFRPLGQSLSSFKPEVGRPVLVCFPTWVGGFVIQQVV